MSRLELLVFGSGPAQHRLAYINSARVHDGAQKAFAFSKLVALVTLVASVPTQVVKAGPGHRFVAAASAFAHRDFRNPVGPFENIDRGFAGADVMNCNI